MINVICAISIVQKLKLINLENNSINATPVTISAFSIGILVSPMIQVRVRLRIPSIPIHAMVPRIVDTNAAPAANRIVVPSACMIMSFPNSFVYPDNENPPQTALLRGEALNEDTISIRIGR